MGQAAAKGRSDDPSLPADIMNSARLSAARSAATSLSGRRPRPGGERAWRTAWSTLAQSSLCLAALTMTSTSCLVTSTPEFTPPKPTRPFLVSSSVDPDARGVLLIDTVEHPKSLTSIQFSADIVSEDQDAKVQGVLYIDYGLVTNDRPFREQIQIADIAASTITDPVARPMRAKWNVGASSIGPGCHTVTMLVTHAIDRVSSCPCCRNDSSQITWQVYSCGGASAATCVPDFSACENWGQGCPASANPDSCPACGALP